jgi:hypothetical protein
MVPQSLIQDFAGLLIGPRGKYLNEEVCEGNCCHEFGTVEIETIWLDNGKRFGSKPKICSFDNGKPCRFYPIYTPETWEVLNKGIPFPTSETTIPEQG